MASTIAVNLVSQCRVIETFSGADSGDNTATFTPMSEISALTASSSVPVAKHSTFGQALTDGAATIDLTTLPGRTEDETVDGTGLKVQILKLRNKLTNANDITVSDGASNGYSLNAAEDSWSIVLDPGQSILLQLNESAPDIASGAKTIDLAGTGTQILEVQVVMG